MKYIIFLCLFVGNFILGILGIALALTILFWFFVGMGEIAKLIFGSYDSSYFMPSIVLGLIFSFMLLVSAALIYTIFFFGDEIRKFIMERLRKKGVR